MAKLDPQVAAHLEWIGFVRPTGLVVSAPALVRAGVILNRRDAEGQRLLRECVKDDGVTRGPAASGSRLPDFRAFADSVLGWSFSPKGYAGTSDAPIPDQLAVQLPEGGGTFRPDFAVRVDPLRSPLPHRTSAAVNAPGAADEADCSAEDGVADMTPQSEATAADGTKDEPSPWQLLVSVIDTGESFDGTVIDGEADTYRSWLDDLRNADPPLASFHWRVEFPEVFDRENPGFDSMVGNPPFLGGRNLSSVQGEVYSKWLLAAHEQSSGGADLVAHFFRRAFDLIRDSGTLGLIATNTIAQVAGSCRRNHQCSSYRQGTRSLPKVLG